MNRYAEARRWHEKGSFYIVTLPSHADPNALKAHRNGAKYQNPFSLMHYAERHPIPLFPHPKTKHTPDRKSSQLSYIAPYSLPTRASLSPAKALTKFNSLRQHTANALLDRPNCLKEVRKGGTLISNRIASSCVSVCIHGRKRVAC
jgi:hypothetical protein